MWYSNHVTPDVRQMFMVNWSKIKFSTRKRRLIAKSLFFSKEIGVNESDSDVGIFDPKPENCNLCARAVQIWPKAVNDDWHDVGRPQVVMHLQLPPSLIIVCCGIYSVVFDWSVCLVLIKRRTWYTAVKSRYTVASITSLILCATLRIRLRMQFEVLKIKFLIWY